MDTNDDLRNKLYMVALPLSFDEKWYWPGTIISGVIFSDEEIKVHLKDGVLKEFSIA